ncbi:concanavalin A-like lectin/glucanase domain-containing protein [Rhodotorula diobovata]|uniref:Concanavalin A-like lectin/glucanase domain-containing protein n=1 Tax=Rhodotorula diobovata TaxID=5288 RepID=A0A5C5G6D1_9BASI|nr:concanavalin A-like lectin/glucanase domain-containing protein [Rhodotorula diobovata]
MLLPALVAITALLAQPGSAYPPRSDHPVLLDALVDDVAHLQERVVGLDERDVASRSALADRATYSCTATTDCTKAAYPIPANSHYACNKARALCTWGCNSNYVASGSTCVRLPKAPSANPVLKRTYSGSSFFDQFDFFSWPDPTHGSVTYLTREAAVAKKLVAASSTTRSAMMQIDRTSRLAVGAPRDSVRIESKEVYQPGSLIILDLKHAPYGPSVWPAFWMYNAPWPDSGEIDVYEGVNSRNFNQYTLHTAPGCTRNLNTAMTGDTYGAPVDCNAGSGSLGCTVFDRDPTSYGAGFNAAGGGVFAVLFAETGISIWRWPRAQVPTDVKRGWPKWQLWGTPVAAWDGATCDTRQFFKNQKLTFDITTCGDWAGETGTWHDSYLSGPGVYPKYATCAAANADPAAFKEAYFEINYLKVYTV